MKKIVMIILVALTANVAVAQSQKKSCDVKDTYVLNGDLIEATLYHDNGTIAQTGFYTLDNELHGQWISFNDQGERTAVANYDNGEKVGSWIFYQGDTMKEVFYESSKISEVKTWTVTDTKVVASNK